MRSPRPGVGPRGGQRGDHVGGDHALGGARRRARRRARPRRAARRRRRPRGTASSPCASSAAITPVSTSPVPAVASAGLPPGLTATRAPEGVGDQGVVALEHHDRPRELRAAARTWRRRSRSISSLEHSSSRPSSPACGVSTVGASARAELAQPARVGVQAVGVEHRSRRGAARASSRAKANAPGLRPRPGPSARAPPRSSGPSTSGTPAGSNRRPRRAARASSPPAGPAASIGCSEAGTQAVT